MHEPYNVWLTLNFKLPGLANLLLYFFKLIFYVKKPLLSSEHVMKHPLLKSMIIALGLYSLPAISQTPGTQKAPLVDLGAEIKVKEGLGSLPGITATDSVSKPVFKTPQAQVGKPSTEQSKVKTPVKEPKKEVHWSYAGETGAKHWGDLAPENIQCKIGKNQSPINLKEKAGVGTSGLPELDVNYRDVPLKIINNGHTVQVNYPLGSYIKLDGHRYELLHFDFHTPSEHQKNGFNYPMEVQLVHKDGEGQLAVIGIIFQEGEENPQIQTLINNLPTRIGKEEIRRGAGINPLMFIPGNTEFYKYSGSLTTPPCSEGVYWMVFKHPIEASIEQIKQLNEVMGENARPIQKINSRTILKSWSEQVLPQQEAPLYEFY